MELLDTYLQFVEERHRVYELRQLGAPQPWTEDPTLATRKFTNVFRVLDPGSQYVFELCPPEADERTVLMRCFLYRYTNRVEPWQALDAVVGLPTVDTLEETRQFWQAYRGQLVKTIARGNRTQHAQKLFSGAYVIMPDPGSPGDKLDKVINLVARLFTPGSPEDIVPEFLAATTQAERFAILLRTRGVGAFMAMQILTDWGYTPQCGEDREDEFVVAGPGATNGARAISKRNPLDLIHELQALVYLGDDVPTVAGRTPSLMDIQNTLCEFSKYVRGPVANTYRPAHPGPQPDPILPDHFRANERNQA